MNLEFIYKEFKDHKQETRKQLFLALMLIFALYLNKYLFMKKLNHWVVLLLATVLISSCTKESKITPAKQSALKVEQTLNSALVKPEQQLMFEMLTPEEKRTLWVNHFTNATLNNGFSSAQNTKVEELITMLTTTNPYDPANSEYRAYMNTVLLPNWKSSVAGLFNETQAYYLLSTTYPSYSAFEDAYVSATATNGTGFNGGGQLNCECKMIAGSSSDCPHTKVIIGTTTGIEVTYGSCPQKVDNTCKTSSWLCGYFWLQSCNGMCGPIGG